MLYNEITTNQKKEFTLMKTIITENLKNTQRYIPHTLETRLAQ